MPPLSTGGAVTQPQTVDESVVSRAARQGAGFVTEASGADLARLAEQSYRALDFTARQAEQKAYLHEVEINAALAADEEYQALENDPSVSPLDLTQRAEEIYKKHGDQAIRTAAGVSREAAAEMSAGMASLRGSRIPGIRAKSYTKQAGVQRAALEKRIFLSKREMYKEGVTEGRQLEIFNRILTDIDDQTGTALSPEQAEGLKQELVDEMRAADFFQQLDTDPVGAYRDIDAYGFSPQRRVQLKQQAEGIIAHKNNQVRQRLNDEKAARAALSDKFLSTLTDMALQGVDPRIELASPEVERGMNAGDKIAAVKFYDYLQTRQKSINEAGIAPTDLLAHEAVLSNGTFSPRAAASYIMEAAASGQEFNQHQVERLMQVSKSAFEARQNFDNKIFDNAESLGEENIKRFLEFKPGFIKLFHPSFRTKLAGALNGALSNYREMLNQTRNLAREQNVDPNEFQNPIHLAERVLLRWLEPAMQALSGQVLDSQAYNVVVKGVKQGDVDELAFAKAMEKELREHTLTDDQMVTIYNLRDIATEFERLKAQYPDTGFVAGQGVKQ